MGLRLSEGLNLDRLAAVSGLQLEAGIVRSRSMPVLIERLGHPRLPVVPKQARNGPWR